MTSAEFIPPLVADLRSSVGTLMRPTLRIDEQDSIQLASSRVRENGAYVLPVVRRDHFLVGAITEASLAKALADDVNPSDAAHLAMEPVTTIRPYASGAEALRLLANSRVPTLCVTDDSGRLMGIIASSDLYPRRRVPPLPPSVGGMATPFGVYLTTGTASGGPPKYALVATGMVMFCLLAGGQLLANQVQLGLIHLYAPGRLSDLADMVLPIAFFLVGLRTLPLASIHAAEHQVVHAIERGEELRPEVVKRMPRVHPRCGTNLAVAAAIFSSLAYSKLIPSEEIRFLLAVIATAFLWRPVGSFVQQFITTRPSSDRHIQQGINSGNELLNNYVNGKSAMPSVWQRIWNGGMLHVMSGSLLVFGILWGVSKVFHLDLGLGL